MADQNKAAEAANVQTLQAEIEALRAQLAAKNAPRTISMRPSKGGGLSLYGLGRWPVTLYHSQWEAVLGAAPLIRRAMRVASKLGLLAADKASKVERSEAEQAAACKAFAEAMAAMAAEHGDWTESNFKGDNLHK